MQVQRKASCKKCTPGPAADNLVLVKSGVKCHTGTLTVVFKCMIKYGTQYYKGLDDKISRDSRLLAICLKVHFLIVSK